MDINLLDYGINCNHLPGYTFRRHPAMQQYSVICFNTPCLNDVATGPSLARPGDVIIHDSTIDEYRRPPAAGRR